MTKSHKILSKDVPINSSDKNLIFVCQSDCRHISGHQNEKLTK